MKRLLAGALAVVAVLAVTGCMSNADNVSENLSKEAERFNVVRSIVGINGITDKVLFEVRGRCSLEYGASLDNTLDVICKEGPGKFKKHYVGLSDNVTFISTQLENVNVSEYRTKIIIKPQNLIPDIDLVTGEQG